MHVEAITAEAVEKLAPDPVLGYHTPEAIQVQQRCYYYYTTGIGSPLTDVEIALDVDGGSSLEGLTVTLSRDYYREMDTNGIHETIRSLFSLPVGSTIRHISEREDEESISL